MRQDEAGPGQGGIQEEAGADEQIWLGVQASFGRRLVEYYIVFILFSIVFFTILIFEDIYFTIFPPFKYLAGRLS